MSSSAKIPTAYRWLWATLVAPAVAAALWMAAPAAHAEDAIGLTPFSSARGAQAPQPWRFTSLPNKAPTRFEVVQQGAQRVLKVEADQSYGNLVHATRVCVGVLDCGSGCSDHEIVYAVHHAVILIIVEVPCHDR